MSLTCTMILGDCLDVLPTMTKHSIDMVFADLPYSTAIREATNQEWDRPFPLRRILDAISSVGKPKVVSCFTANDSFAACVAQEAGPDFRYSLVWLKQRGSLYYHANKRPLLKHEWIQILSKPKGCYRPIKTAGRAYKTRQAGPNVNMRGEKNRWATINDGDRHPSSVLSFSSVGKEKIHPTQKPVALLDWLVRTYSNPEDMVLDPASGSFTTSTAAALCGRSSIGIEKDVTYFEAAVERMHKIVTDNKLTVKVEVLR